MDAALAKAAQASDKRVGENCVDCHGQDFKGVGGKHVVDLSNRATLYGSENVDTGPNEIFMIAGGVSLAAVVGLFLLGFFSSREQIRSAD